MKSFNRTSRLASRGGPAFLLALLGASAAAASPADAQAYNVYRGRLPSGTTFHYAPTCLLDNLTQTVASDADLPGAGELFYYTRSTRTTPAPRDHPGPTAGG